MTDRIPGVRLERLVRHADPRGSLREAWRLSWYAGADGASLDAGASAVEGFVQANVSVSATGVLRGLHLHRRQLDHWVVLDGRATIALVDVRPMLAGADRPTVDVFAAEADDRITIPAGVAHGFLAHDPLTLLYLVTAEYDGSDELGFAWDDPVAAVRWPPAATADGRPLVSERDRAAPSLLEILELLRD